MKLRDAWGNAMKFVGVAALLCCVLLLAFPEGARKHIHAGKAGSMPAVDRAARAGDAEENRRWAEAYGKLPMSFEENQGQTAREVRYVAHGGGYELFLTAQEAVMALRPATHLDFSPRHRSSYLRALGEQRRAAQTQTMTAIRMRLDGANPEPEISGAERLPTRVNYFTGSDPKNWHTDVPAYAGVKYAGIYPGVDLVFYGNQGRLEYDFVVAPGADPKAIQLRIDGARKMRVNPRGDLVLSLAEGEVEFQKPILYQQQNGQRREIAGNYVIAGNHRVIFSVASYDRSKPLILDPVLNYSTYLGGGGAENTTLPVGIAVDSAGDAFVVGDTFSTDFPTTANGLKQGPLAGNLGASFVAEMNPAGTQLLYSSYLVGTTTTAFDGATSVAVDATGKVYVTGVTAAAGFPSKNPLPYSADTVNGTCFVTKLDPSQSGNASLVFSTYLGGTVGTGSFANGIAVDGNGNAYVVGETSATDFPTNGTNAAYQPAFNPLNASNASGSAFLSRIDTTTSTLVYSTYLSGNAAHGAGAPGTGDLAYGVAVDTSNNAYVVGQTSSNNSTGFPSSTNANEPVPPAANVVSSAFVSKVNTAGSGLASLVYSTYIAGSTQEIGFGIALGPNNIAYATGLTSSNDFPVTTGAFDTSGVGAGKAFVALVDTTNTVVGNPVTPFRYATFLGGSGGDTGYGIRVDSTGNAYVVGTATSTDFPLTPGPLQATLLNPKGDAFIAKLFPGGNGKSDLLYSTYFGGAGNGGTSADQGYGIAIDSATPPNVYITGQTVSTNLPVLTPLPGGGSLKGTSDAYVAKLALVPTLTIAPSPFNFGTQPVGATTAPQAFQVTNNTSSGVTFNSIVVTGVSPANNTDFAISSDGCSPSVAAGAAPCAVNVTFKPSVVAAESATLVITAVVTNGGQASTDVFKVNLSGTGLAAVPGVGFNPTSLAFGNQVLNTTSTAKPVTLTNTGNAALTINSIAASGDFAATSTGASACPISPATLAAGANCTINVTFTPTVLGARAGTLTVTDNAAGSPHTVGLTGTGIAATPDFGLTGPTAVQNVTDGQTLMFNVTVTGVNGFNSPVALTCTGAPAQAVCTVTSPVTPPVAPPSSIPAQVSMTTKAFIVPPPTERTPPLSPRQVVPLILAFLLLLSLRSARRPRMRLAMAATLLLLIAFAGCSGIKGLHTPKGPAILTITGTSGSLTHTVQVNISVN
jgi:hypothetical protein